MSQERVQNLQNHAHTPKELIIESLLLLIALLLIGAGIVVYQGADGAADPAAAHSRGFLLLGLGALMHAATAVYICLHMRFADLKLQDRIIRLETQTRLYRVLPVELHAQIPSLDLGQLVSMRFASDEELGALAQQVFAGNIKDRKAIKKLVKNWQADWMRI